MTHQIQEDKWKIKFEDGYEMEANETKLQEMLILRQGESINGKQLDYILLTNRWMTSVKDSNVRWGPSEHRNVYGKADHALVECEIKWKIRSPKTTLKKDYSVLFDIYTVTLFRLKYNNISYSRLALNWFLYGDLIC